MSRKKPNHAGYTGSWSLLEVAAVMLALIVGGIALLIGKCNGAIK